jgi:meckelin
MYFDTDYSCVCREGFIITGEAAIGPQSCIERYPTITDGYTKATFKRPVAIGKSLDGGGYDFSLDSIIFSHSYLRSASLCEFFSASQDSLQACQALGNLCVMSMYDENSAACRSYLSIVERRIESYNGQEEWKKTLPWLYYQGEADDVINDRGIKMKMAFHSEENAFSQIDFRIAKFRLDGSFVGIEDLKDQFEYCATSNNNKENTSWKQFGQGYRIEYSCDIGKLVNREMFFFDIYMIDKDPDACNGDTADIDCLYPVQVLNRNIVENDAFPNMNLGTIDEENDRYTRRFFLFDNQVSLYCSQFTDVVLLSR